MLVEWLLENFLLHIVVSLLESVDFGVKLLFRFLFCSDSFSNCRFCQRILLIVTVRVLILRNNLDRSLLRGQASRLEPLFFVRLDDILAIASNEAVAAGSFFYVRRPLIIYKDRVLRFGRHADWFVICASPTVVARGAIISRVYSLLILFRERTALYLLDIFALICLRMVAFYVR